MITSHILTWVRSLRSPTIFVTKKDCNNTLVYCILLLKGRLTKVSDFFPGERGRKKNKKVFRRSLKIF